MEPHWTGSEDDEDEAASTKVANLAALEQRRHEVKSKLRTVVNSLRDAGAVTNGYDSAYFLEPLPPDYPSASIHDRLFQCHKVQASQVWLRHEKQLRFEFDPPDEYQLEWRISALGREKCASVFERFDVDEDGAWNYSEFLEYLAALERERDRPDIRAFADDPEVWLMYMSDLFDMDAHLRLTFPGFILYREAIEQDSPLENDLRVLKIPMEWEGLKMMRRCSRIFDEYADTEGGVGLKTAQYLFAEAGRALSFHELCDTIHRQRLMARCFKSILQPKRSLRLFGYHQKMRLLYTNPVLDEEPKICKPGFLSLVLSSWTPASKTRWRQWLMRSRLVAFTKLRQWQRATSWAFDSIRLITRTGLLRASCLFSHSPQQERGDYVFKMDVGSRFSTHATMHVSYNSDADSAAALHELKYLERGAECFAYIDLACRSGAKDNDVQWITQKLTWFLHEYFRDHLESLPFFYKWFVTVPSKLQLRSGPTSSIGTASSSSASATLVIRIVVLFSGKMDLYQVMQSLHLPSSVQFDHLLQRFSFRWLCSNSLEEILTSKRLVLGSQWACRAQLDTRLNKQAFAQILSQLATKLETDATQEADEFACFAREKAAFNGVHHEQQQQGSSSPKKASAVSSSNQNEATGNDGDDKYHRVHLWLRDAANMLSASHEVSATFSFANLNDMLLGNRWIASVLPSKLYRRVKHVLTTPGGVAAEWKSGCDSFRSEFASARHFQGSSDAGGGSRTWSRASSRSSAQLTDDFNAISGLEHSIASAFPFATPASTSEALKRSVNPTSNNGARGGGSSSRPETGGGQHGADEPGEKKAESLTKDEIAEHELLELYDMCAKHLMGVNVIRAEAGTSGITCVLEGWNFFNLLPRVQSHLVKRQSIVRTRSSA